MRPIDADAFKDYIMDGIADHEDIPPSQFSIVEAAAKGFLLDIDEQPTISPDDVRGVAFWVDTQPHLDDSSYKKDGMSYYCSNCHHRAGKYKHRSYKFCPWCGAKIVPKEMAVRNED